MSLSRLADDGIWENVSEAQHSAEIVAALAAKGINICPTCVDGIPLPDDGSCRRCEYRAALPEGLRGKEGIGWRSDVPREDREAAAALWCRYDALTDWVERDAKIPPNACSQCGVGEQVHGQRYGIGGWHTWIAPTDRQRKERMLARRAVAEGRGFREVNRRFVELAANHTSATKG